MNTREYVEYLLKNYNEIRADIEVLKVDIEQINNLEISEIIESLSLSPNMNERVQTSNSSDKTSKVALVYSQVMKRLTDQSRKEIQKQIVLLELELARLEICIKRLNPTIADVLRSVFFEKCSWERIRSKLNISEKTLNRYKRKGIDEICQMFENKRLAI